MSKFTRTIACLVAFCLMLGGIALADDFGIGEAAAKLFSGKLACGSLSAAHKAA